MAVRWGKMVSEAAQARQAAGQGFEFLRLGEGPSAEELSALGGVGLPVEVCAVPLPADVRVTQQGFNLYVWAEHLKGALKGLAGLGCRTLTWSEGRARLLPAEGEVAVLKEQVLQFLFMLCELAGAFGMRVLVEPLGPRRTNFLNSLQEAGEFLRRVGKANLGVMLSQGQMSAIGLALADLAERADLAGRAGLIGHVHLDEPAAPAARDLLRELRAIGYSGDISLPVDADEGALNRCRNTLQK